MNALIRKQPPPDDAHPQVSLLSRLRHRMAAHLPVAPFNATSDVPAVSFTFDDVPVSAATEGARLMEEAGARGTYYVAGGLMGQQDDHWQVMNADGVVDLHARGHEIGCHSHGHKRADEISVAEFADDLARNHALLKAVEPSLPLENFAYPYGYANMAWKRCLKNRFTSSRSIRPRINHGATDAHYLYSLPLVNREITEGQIDRAFEETARRKGWLIFYSHDVAVGPSDYGCSPRLLRHALKAAQGFGVKVETVKAAMTRIGAQVSAAWIVALPII